MGWQNILYRRIYVDFSFLAVHNVCTKAILLGERSVRIREVKGSNPSRSTFSSSVILTLLLFFCVHISQTLALGPGWIRTARPCRRQGKQQPTGLLLRARVPTSRNVYRGDFRFCRIVLYDAAFLCLKTLADRAGLRTLKSDANRVGSSIFIPGRPAGWCGSTPWGSCRTPF